jgi:hypothetical protein
LARFFSRGVALLPGFKISFARSWTLSPCAFASAVNLPLFFGLIWIELLLDELLELLLLAIAFPFRLRSHRLKHPEIKLLRVLVIHVREFHRVLRQLYPVT